MPFDGSGNFNRVFNWATDKANSIDITASRFDTEDNGFATGLSNAITRDGQGKPTAPINWNNQTITNAASITLNGDPSTALQVTTKQYVDNNIQSGAQKWGATAGGTANALTLTMTPVVTAYTDGLMVLFLTGASPNSGAVTLALNGLAAKNYVRQDGTAFSANDLPPTTLQAAVYDATAGNFKELSLAPSQLLNAANTWNAAQTFVASGNSPITVRRTESDSAYHIIFKGLRGNGSGAQWITQLLDDGANNVVGYQENINGIAVRMVTTASNEFPAPIDLDAVATPANPGAGKLRVYAKAGLAALWNRLGTGGAELLIQPVLPSAAGLVITNNATTPNSKIDITVAQAILTDSNGIAVFYTGGTLTVDLNASGANGLDTGTFVASQQYFSFLIYNPTTNTFASLASLSSTAPTLPSGYVHFVRVGAMNSDATPNLFRFVQRGDTVQYKIVAATNTAAYFTAASKPASTAATSFSVSSWVPPTAKSVKFNGTCTAANSWTVGPNGQIAIPPGPDLILPSASVATGSILPFDMQFETAQTAFVATGGTASTTTIAVIGYRDAVNAT